MKKKIAIGFSEGPTMERRQHTSFVRDVLAPAGAPVIARHRARPILTPLSARRAIMDDVAEKPEAVRLRSLRRRLTALDRALSEREAAMLERLTSCINNLSNVGCLNLLRSEVRSSPYGRLPFGEAKGHEIAAMNFVLKTLKPTDRALVLGIAGLLDPSRDTANWKADEPFILAVRLVAQRIVASYDEWESGRRTRHAAIIDA